MEHTTFHQFFERIEKKYHGKSGEVKKRKKKLAEVISFKISGEKYESGLGVEAQFIVFWNKVKEYIKLDKIHSIKSVDIKYDPSDERSLLGNLAKGTGGREKKCAALHYYCLCKKTNSNAFNELNKLVFEEKKLDEVFTLPFFDLDVLKVMTPDTEDIFSPNLKLDIRPNQNHFSNSPIKILGRDEQQNILWDFLAPQINNFSWMQIAGVGGQGKSRLAFDLATKAKNDWHAGFIEGNDLSELSENIKGWQPTQKTLIVIDYVIGNAPNVKAILQELAKREKFNSAVRILLLERQRWDRGGLAFAAKHHSSELNGVKFSSSDGKASWFLELCVRGDGLDTHIHETRLKDDREPNGIIELTELAPKQLSQIVLDLHAKEKENQSPITLSQKQIEKELEHLDKEGRPLYAYFLAQALIAGDYQQGASLYQLLQGTLERERKQRWNTEFGDSPPALTENTLSNKIALLATMAGHFQLSKMSIPDHWGQLSPRDIQAAQIITDTPKGTMESAPNIVLALQPDILGEWFVLHALLGGFIDFEELSGLAWKANSENMATFLLHCTQDFVDHSSGVVQKLLGVPLPDEKALVALSTVAANIILKLHHAQDKFYPEAMFEAMEVVCNAKDSGALVSYGYFYLVGIGVQKDLQRGVELLQRAVELKDANALFFLGLCYQNSCGVKQDLQKAVKLYQQAAELGNSGSIVHLGLCHEKGYGVEKDMQKAAKLYQQAAELGIATAMFNLGFCHEKGNGVEKDMQRAIELYQQAVELRNIKAMNNLGLCYQIGNGVKQDLHKAVKLYQQAAVLGNANAMDNLGVCYENGFGVEPNLQRAVKLFQQAAELGNPIAMQRLRLFHL